MKNLPVMTGVLTLLILSAAVAPGDWDPGDGHKMHFPQLPDLQGWDVNLTLTGVGARRDLADDWSCSRSGSVSDIHVWFSSREDRQPLDVQRVYATIYSDVPADQSGTGYSQPGQLLWSREFQPGEFTIRQWGEGDQGWYDPAPPEPLTIPNDHQIVFQANMVDIPRPFLQQEGEIYWLSVNLDGGGPPEPVELGWKTSEDHFNDSAVWHYGAAVDPPTWRELRDPLSGEGLDLAFVVTPEPGALVMLATLGLAGLAGYLRRRLPLFRQG